MTGQGDDGGPDPALPVPLPPQEVAWSPPAFGDFHRTLLTFEQQADYRSHGRKDAAILDLLGINEARYYQALNWAIDQSEGAAFDGPLVARLQRIRTLRKQARQRGVTP